MQGFWPTSLSMLLVLVCGLLYSSAGVAGLNVGGNRDVSDWPSLQEALKNPAVTTITLTKDIIVNPDDWKTVINITRNLAITGNTGDFRRMWGVEGVVRKLHVAPNITVTYSDLSLNGTSYWEPGVQPQNIQLLYDYSPDSISVFEGVAIYGRVCAPVKQSKSVMEAISRGVARPKPCPPGLQQVSLQKFCNLQECFVDAWTHPDFCIKPPKRELPMGILGDQVERYLSMYLACDNMKRYPCVRQSLKQRECDIPPELLNLPPNSTSPPTAAPGGASAPGTITAPGTAPEGTTTRASSPKKKSSSFPIAAIIGAAVGGVVLLCLVAMLLVFRKRLCGTGKAASDKESLPVTAPMTKAHPGDGSSTNNTSTIGGSRSTGTEKIRHGNDQGMLLNNYAMSTTHDAVELSTLLGRGSFGSVFKGHWRNQDVAVKILQHDSLQLQHIQNEAHLNTCLHHANIASALQIIHKRLGTTPRPAPSDVQSLHDQSGSVELDTPMGGDMMETWIIMELCDQGSLETLSRKGMFQKDGRLYLHPLLMRLRDVAAGMSYIHGKNICHGDLKAGNVLVATSDNDPYGCVAKVADFGLSRVMLSAQSHLSTRTMGTPSRMPPELLLKGQMSPAGDVYAFGILVYESSTGELPFQNMAIGELIHRVVMNHERPTLPPHLPQALSDLATACWSPDRDKRPSFRLILQQVDAMLAHVDSLQAGVDAYYDAQQRESPAPPPRP